jgi:ABC-type polysaccharide/polyol phosphate transport system ATPase subunit
MILLEKAGPAVSPIENAARAVSREGRTIFLVSHNLDSIRSLCKRVFLLSSGRLCEEQETEKAIAIYINDKGP